MNLSKYLQATNIHFVKQVDRQGRLFLCLKVRLTNNDQVAAPLGSNSSEQVSLEGWERSEMLVQGLEVAGGNACLFAHVRFMLTNQVSDL